MRQGILKKKRAFAPLTGCRPAILRSIYFGSGWLAADALIRRILEIGESMLSARLLLLLYYSYVNDIGKHTPGINISARKNVFIFSECMRVGGGSYYVTRGDKSKGRESNGVCVMPKRVRRRGGGWYSDQIL